MLSFNHPVKNVTCFSIAQLAEHDADVIMYCINALSLTFSINASDKSMNVRPHIL